MESPRQQQRAVLLSDPAIQLVMRWRGLSGPGKIAFLYLWELAGGRRASVNVNPAAIAERQGTSDSSGRRALRSMEACGLIQVLTSDCLPWRVYVENPLDVERARLLRISANEESEFPLCPNETLPENVTEESASVPFSSPSDKPNGGSAALPPLPMKETSTSDIELRGPANTSSSDIGRGGSAALPPQASLQHRAKLNEEQEHAAKGEPNGVNTLEVLDRLERMRHDRDADKNAIVELITAVVRDPKLSMAKCELIAEAIFNGTYTRRKLERVLSELLDDVVALAEKDPDGFGRKTPEQQRGSFFNGVMKRQFEECGLNYSEKPSSPAQTNEVQF